MKRFTLGLCLLALLTTGARAADAPLHPRSFKIASVHVVPLPRERPPEIRIAQATNPDPFNIKRADQAGAPAPVTQAASPIVVAAPPAQSDSLLGYIWAAIGAIFTALFGKLTFKLPQIPGVAAASGTSVLNYPSLRANLDAALLKAVQSGVPGQALQSGLGLIPGAAPFVATLEPWFRNIVIQELQKRAPAADTSTDAAAPAPQAVPLQAQLTALTSVVQELIKMHAAKPAVP